MSPIAVLSISHSVKRREGLERGGRVVASHLALSPLLPVGRPSRREDLDPIKSVVPPLVPFARADPRKAYFPQPPPPAAVHGRTPHPLRHKPRGHGTWAQAFVPFASPSRASQSNRSRVKLPHEEMNDVPNSLSLPFFPAHLLAWRRMHPEKTRDNFLPCPMGRRGVQPRSRPGPLPSHSLRGITKYVGMRLCMSRMEGTPRPVPARQATPLAHPHGGIGVLFPSSLGLVPPAPPRASLTEVDEGNKRVRVPPFFFCMD